MLRPRLDTCRPSPAPACLARPGLAQVHGAVAQRSEADTHDDIYLVPPSTDPESCSSWLRLRNRDGRYSLMFEEWMAEGDFIISPRISFEVRAPEPVRV